MALLVKITLSAVVLTGRGVVLGTAAVWFWCGVG
jgi:hypothetical protein